MITDTKAIRTSGEELAEEFWVQDYKQQADFFNKNKFTEQDQINGFVDRLDDNGREFIEKIYSSLQGWRYYRSRFKYMSLSCPECGEPLEVYYDGPRNGDPEGTLIRHCEKCLCDWENEWQKNGSESELRRKFWG